MKRKERAYGTRRKKSKQKNTRLNKRGSNNNNKKHTAGLNKVKPYMSK